MNRILTTLCIGAAVALVATVARAQTTCPDSVAQLVSPAPGSTLPVGAVTFTWCNAGGDYFLDIESVPGAHDIFYAFVVGVESVTLGPECAPAPPTGCIPPNGETIYVTLWTNTAHHGPSHYVAAPTVSYTAGSSVGVPPTPAVAFDLGASVPNPAAVLTHMSFTLARAGRVRLRIYGLDGERVRTLVDGDRPAGLNAASWDGRDDHGRAVDAGVYFCRLDGFGQTRLRRLAWLR
ncbi:MAG TPA: FlgD immunoglobulin-like domain containing protein [Candidatus Eisenbacteria bacterium]|nr:FlgD immunoglobulin-like domain containing protein [Candidatus Eisenbacteria bacterium]